MDQSLWTKLYHLFSFICKYSIKSQTHTILHKCSQMLYESSQKKIAFLTSKIFPQFMNFLYLIKTLLVIFRKYIRCTDIIFCMNTHNHIVHHYCRNCISNFQTSSLILENLKTPKFTFSGLLWKNETSYSYIFWNEYAYYFKKYSY